MANKVKYNLGFNSAKLRSLKNFEINKNLLKRTDYYKHEQFLKRLKPKWDCCITNLFYFICHFWYKFQLFLA